MRVLLAELRRLNRKVDSQLRSMEGSALEEPAELVPPSGDQRYSSGLVGPALLSMGLADQEERRLRRTHFPTELCDGPSWAVLIDLMVSQLSDVPVSVTAACATSGAPATTTLRYIVLLEEEGLVKRMQDPVDQRRKWLALTRPAFEKFARYFIAVRDLRMRSEYLL